MNKRSIVLPGQSRSTSCSTRGCHRLLGHKGEHRSTLSSRPGKASAEPTKASVKAPTKSATKARRPRRWTKSSLKDYRQSIAVKAEAGELTFGEALSRISRADDQYAAQRRSRRV